MAVDLNTMPKEFDVIVAGGGPGGSATAALLGRQGVSVLLLDRAKFPRDKTCGDAISGKSVSVLRELGVVEELERAPHAKIMGVAFSSPDGTYVDIPMAKDEKGEVVDYGYCCRREVYDNVLFENARKHSTAVEEFLVDDVIIESGFARGVRGKGKDGVPREFRCKVLVGADGATSVVARKTGLYEMDGRHWCAAIRAYYKGVKGMTNSIELHFVDEVLPGYFWIFPLEDGLANVGVGMLLKDIGEKKMNLQEEMFKLVENHSSFKERFKGAERVSPVKGWNLPFGSKRRKAYGNGFVLVGDAASLIDPFTGEGIGNALVSGSIAARHIKTALEKNDFSEAVFREYDAELWATVGPEMRTSYYMQRLGGKAKFLLNMLIRKAARSEKAREAIAGTFINTSARKNYFSPMFYLKMLLS